MSLKIKYVRCGKQRCRVCASGRKHGPYLYERISKNGKKHDVYMMAPGRARPKAVCPVCEQEFRQSKPWHAYCSKRCKQRAYYRRTRQFPEFYGGTVPQKAKNDESEQRTTTTTAGAARPTLDTGNSAGNRPSAKTARQVPMQPASITGSRRLSEEQGTTAMKKQQQDQPHTLPAPSLAAALLATIQEWQKTYALTEDQLLVALETAWQEWGK